MIIAQLVPLLLFAQDVRILSVCQVVQQLQALNGSLITVQGAIAPGVMVIQGESCLQHVVVKEFEFWDGIELYPTDLDRRLALHYFSFAAPEEFRRLHSLWRAAGKQNRILVCTITGMIETWTPMTLLIDKHDLPQGFGQEGRLPARMIVKHLDSCQERTGRIHSNEGGPVKKDR